MTLPEYITYLHPPKKIVTPSSSPFLLIGKRYPLENLPLLADQSIHGLIGGYSLESRTAEILPFEASESDTTAVYFWDSHCDLAAFPADVKTSAADSALPLAKYRLSNNRLELQQARLNGPEITTSECGALLSLSAHFEFTFSTDAFAARVAMLHLVQAKRYAVLEDGTRVMLLDSGEEDEPVLYLTDADANQTMAWMSPDQPFGESQSYQASSNISQIIPEQLQGQAVTDLIVLEHYSSYILQHAIPMDDEQTIWTPLYSPISWGWSIRAGRRHDGVWDVMRRKLMLPITGHEGMQLPLWRSNNLSLFDPDRGG